MKKYTFVIALLISVFSVYSQIPETISWQGVLQDSDAKNLSGNYNLTVKLFDVSSGGNNIWSETHSGIIVEDGLANLSLGSITPFNLNFANDYWLEITIENGTPLPRISLTSVPYALRAKSVETGDNWGNQSVVSDATLTGNGTSTTPLSVADGAITGSKIAQGGATSGQMLKWNGTAWAPGNDELGGLTLPFDGTALTAEVGSSALKVSNSGTNQVVAIIGHATATTGDSRGVYGRSDAPDGRGVQGYASNTTGSAFGVAGFTNSNNAAGVYGSATSSTGAAYGVEGYTGSTQGTGVYGYAGTSSGTTYGVQGRSSSTSGTGVQGEATASSGATEGVTGRSSSTSGTGVFGTASATSGYTHGVFGSTISPNGRAVGARSVSSTGTTYGVHSQVLSSAGFSGYFTGGKFHVSGNVGIGTESPGYRLDVYAPTNSNTGIAVFRNFSGQSKIELRQNSNGAGAIELKNSGSTTTVLLSGDGNNYINGGSLGIGTTAPSQALHVVGNVRVSAIGSGAYSGVVNRTSDGTFTTSSSDVRLKENIMNLDNSLDKVVQLQGVSFTWKSNPEYGSRIGFIAQEFEKVLPELVFTNEVDGYKGINYAEVSAVLVEAIKEQKQLIDTQNERIKDLENKLEQFILKYSNTK
jgi:hypothetical protein